MFEQRCACRCEEPAIEGRDAQVAGLTAVVCEARDGLEGFPEPARSIRAFGGRTQPLHRVSIAVDRMPRRHEATGLGEAEKQDAVDGRQRLLVERLQWRRPPSAPPATTVEESGQQVLDCAVDTGPEGRAHRLPVRVGGRNRVRESPVGSMRRCRAQAGGRRERNQQASRRLRISGGLQVEVEVPSRKRAAGVEHAQMRAVEQQAPAHVQRQALADRGAPRPVERRAPGGKDDRNRRPVGLEYRHPRVAVQRPRRPQLEPEQRGERRRGHIEEHARARCGTTPRAHRPPPRRECRDRAALVQCRLGEQQRFSVGPRDERSREAGQLCHRSTSATTGSTRTPATRASRANRSRRALCKCRR